MNETAITVVGNVATDPAMVMTKNGTPVVHFRLASTARRLDRDSGEWRDTATLWLRVNCWRRLGEHVSESIVKGDRVIVQGRLTQSTWEDAQGGTRSSLEVEASAVGPDLSRGTVTVQRPRRAAAAEDPSATEDPWAVAAPAARDPFGDDVAVSPAGQEEEAA